MPPWNFQKPFHTISKLHVYFLNVTLNIFFSGLPKKNYLGSPLALQAPLLCVGSWPGVSRWFLCPTLAEKIYIFKFWQLIECFLTVKDEKSIVKIGNEQSKEERNPSQLALTRGERTCRASITIVRAERACRMESSDGSHPLLGFFQQSDTWEKNIFGKVLHHSRIR